jgi:hypothetical protein
MTNELKTKRTNEQILIQTLQHVQEAGSLQAWHQTNTCLENFVAGNGVGKIA